MRTKYHLILMSNERATAYTNIHLFTCKHCDVIKFKQFLLIFARFLAIFCLILKTSDRHNFGSRQVIDKR